jgi:cytochrome P460
LCGWSWLLWLGRSPHAVGIRQTDGEATPIYGVRIPAGYRDWPLVSIATVGAPVSDMRAKLGNDVAIKPFRADTVPFPDGTIIARLAWKQTTSEENNRALGPVAETPSEEINVAEAAAESS